MFTLKIHWWREESHDVPDSDDGKGKPIRVGGSVDETTLYIPADEVHVLARILDPKTDMRHWHEGQYFNYQSISDEGGRYEARLIQVIRKGEDDVWYLASRAWLLGPTGDTIERVAP